MVRYVENLPHAPPDDRHLPDLAFAFYDQMVVFDHVDKTVVVVVMARVDGPGTDLRKAYDVACAQVKAMNLGFTIYKRKDMRHSKTVDFFWYEGEQIKVGSEVWGEPEPVEDRLDGGADAHGGIAKRTVCAT